MTDSTTGGYLAPGIDTSPTDDDALDALIRDLISGLTALPGDLVRPRWQATVPTQPDPSVNWCAFEVQDQGLDASPLIQHIGTGDGHDVYVRHQTIDVLCTFQGPSAKGYAQRFADGFAVPQNREQLQRQEMAFVGVGPIRPTPEPVNQPGTRRVDLTVTLRRKIIRTYAVLNLKSASVQVDGEHGVATVKIP
jgi:hypothetical protein